MTTELEKQFFDTFGIEAKEFKSCDVDTFCPYPEKECGTDTCPYYRTYKVDYPAISDRILLELICILSKYQKDRGSLLEIYEISLDEIKEEILEMLIYRVDGCKQRVQALFEENNNDI